MSQSVEVEIRHPLAIVTLKRPPVNALDEAALNELKEAADRIDNDPDVRAAMITSGIEGIFCAGGDLKYWPRMYPKQAEAVSEAGRTVFTRIQHLMKPSVAVIQGHVSGDGLSLALACDLRLADQDSTFLLPELDYGFIPGWGTIGRLVEVVGRSATAEMLLLGKSMSAERAKAIGLVNEIREPQDLMPFAQALAIRIAEKPRLAVRFAKAALNGNSHAHSSDHNDWETRCFVAVWGGTEWKEGIQRLFSRNKTLE